MSTPDTAETAHHFDDDWTVYVSVPVEEEIGYKGGHTSGGRGFSWSSDMSDADVIAAIDEQHQRDLEALSRNRRFRLRVTRDAVDVVVLDEERRMSGPQAELLWPPIVTGAGLVVRWVRDTASTAPEDGGEVRPGTAPLPLGTEIQRPWFVEQSGAVRQLPFELAVRPLGADEDGRLLLPGRDPLWWDGRNEPFTWIDLEGNTEPLLIDGGTVTPRRICESIGERWEHETDHFDGPGWEPVQGYRAGDELTVRLLTDTDDGRRWVTVALSLAGSWRVAVTGRGEGADDEPLPPF